MAKVPVVIKVSAVDAVTPELGKIEARVAAFSQRLSGVQKSFGETQKRFEGLAKAGKMIGGGMQTAGRALSLGITLPVIGLGASVLKTAGEFEAAMLDLKAKTGGTREELEALKKSAREIGATTQFSATEATGAMIELAKAGFKTGEIMEGTKSVMALAGSEGMELASAATIVADTMSQFGLKASDTGRIVDVLSKTANVSTTDVRGLAESLAYAGGIARANNISLEETNAVLGVFASRGVKGSRAGTALATSINNISSNRKAILTLQSLGVQTKDLFDQKDKLGSFIRLIQVLEKVKPSSMQLTKIFGEEAGRSIVQLIGQSGALKTALVDVQNSAGFAAEQNATRMQGFDGAVKQLKASFEELQLQLSESGFLAAATEVIKSVTGLLKKFQGLDEGTKKNIITFALVAAVMGPVTYALGSLVNGLVLALPLIGTLASALGILKFAFMGLLRPIVAAFAAMLATPGGVVILAVGGIIAALAALGYGIYKLWENWDKVWDWIKEKGEGFVNWFKDTMADIGSAFKGDFSGLTMRRPLRLNTMQTPSALGPSARPYAAPLPVYSSALPFLASRSAEPAKAEVTVNFENAPRGTRIQKERSTSVPFLNTNIGFMMENN